MDVDKVGGWFEVTMEMLEDAEIRVMVVEELPKKGEVNTFYLTPKHIYASKFNSDEVEIVGTYFEKYVMIDGKWCLVGTTKIEIEQDDTEVKPHNLVPLRSNEVG